MERQCKTVASLIVTLLVTATPIFANQKMPLLELMAVLADWDTGQVMMHQSCAGADCFAKQDLAQAYDALEGRDFPNTLVRLGGYQSYLKDLKSYNHVLDDLPRKHPDRVPLYCIWLTRIAEHDPDSYGGEHLNTAWVIELAARLDSRDGHCIAGVMNALPHTESMNKLIAYEREGCFLNYPHHHCAAITRSPTMP